MKYKDAAFFLVFLWCLIASGQSKAQITLNYPEFDVFAKPPKKMNDTLEYKVTRYYPDHLLRIYLKDYGGASYIELFDKDKKLVMTGNYNSGRDTLLKYRSAVHRGYPTDKKYYTLWLLKYLMPLQTGTWTYFDKKGKVTEKVEYEYKFGN